MLKNTFLFLFLTLGIIPCSKAQITFSEAPKQGAFFAQDKANRSANVTINGFVNQTIYRQLEINLLKNGILEQTFIHPLTFFAGKAIFDQSLTLKTGKHFYTIKYSLTGSASYSEQVSNLCVGDVYLVQGQSNAVAASYNAFNPKYNDQYIRSFGSSGNNAASCLADSFWHDIDPVFSYTSGAVGQWAAVMAKHLLDSFNTPICLLNGAVGGTRIDQHQPILWDRANLNSIYGRLLHRAQKSQLDSAITGIFYFQGESDGGNAVKHDTMFTNLYNAWAQDFPGFQKLYLIQVREGCGAPSIQLRDIQRRFEYKLPKCKTVSANGLNNHDGCHYGFVNGYEKLGMQLSKLVGKDFYWSAERENINPPNIKSCFYSNGRQTEITLNFVNPNDLVYADPDFEKLFKIEGDDSVKIIGGSIKNNRIVLLLSKNSCQITGISYNGLRGNQPWVKNKIGFGLISFYNIAIKNHDVKDNLFFCKSKLSRVGTSPLKEVTYELKQLSTGKTFPTAQANFILQKKDSFRLILRFDSLPCVVNDTVIIYVDVDPVQLPELGKDTALCIGNSITYAPFKANFFQFNWFINQVLANPFYIKVDSSANIKLNATSNAGCNYKDQVNVTLRNPQTYLDSVFYICKNTNIQLTLKDTFMTYYWNTLKGNASKLLNEGNHNLTAVDSFGCITSHSFKVLPHVPKPLPQINETICAETTVRISKPTPFVKWYSNTRTLDDFLYLAGVNNLLIILEDSNHCIYKDSLKTRLFEPLPFPALIDTIVCAGSTFKLVFPANQKEYWVNQTQITDAIALLPYAAETNYSIKDQQGCFRHGTLRLKQAVLPIMKQWKDTVLCEYDSLTLKTEIGIKTYVDDILIADGFNFRPNSAYVIKQINADACEAEKTIYISSKKCTSSSMYPLNIEIKVYPNPFLNSLTFSFSHDKKEQMSLYDLCGKLVLSQQVKNNEKVAVSHLPPGIYYLKTVNSVWKIRKE